MQILLRTTGLAAVALVVGSCASTPPGSPFRDSVSGSFVQRTTKKTSEEVLIVRLSRDYGLFHFDSNLNVIASGGISTGLEAAKCLALGANLVSSARPMLKAFHDGGKKGLRALIGQWATELCAVMFLTGSSNIHALQRAPLVWSRGR